MKEFLSFVLFLFLGNILFGQQITLSENAEISMITVDPGNSLVGSFGHSAIRVKDTSLGLDIAYNYGTFDFEAPNFYLNFAKGKLFYALGKSYFHNFLRYYVGQNRSVKEQVLDLSILEKQNFFSYLQNNAKPENKGYFYDFFYDNCATKLIDVSEDVLKEKVSFDYSFANDEDYTMRGLIHKYSKTQPWGTLGIDLALGSVIDRKATPKEYTFLPDYIFEAFKNAEITTENKVKPIIKKNNLLFESQPKKKVLAFNLTPLLSFALLAVIVIIITYSDIKKNKRSKWLDFTIFLVTGLLGLLMLLLWFTTDHTATANNYNILWAFAPNLFVAFLFLKKEMKPWLQYYIFLLIALLLVSVIVWVLKIQVFNSTLIAIMAILMVRYTFLLQRVKA